MSSRVAFAGTTFTLVEGAERGRVVFTIYPPGSEQESLDHVEVLITVHGDGGYLAVGKFSEEFTGRIDKAPFGLHVDEISLQSKEVPLAGMEIVSACELYLKFIVYKVTLRNVSKHPVSLKWEITHGPITGCSQVES